MLCLFRQKAQKCGWQKAVRISEESVSAEPECSCSFLQSEPMEMSRSCLCVFSRRGCTLISLSSSDDWTEEAEAADRPVGTPSAHEHQPPAACVNSAAAAILAAPVGVWTQRSDLHVFTSVWLWVWKYLNTVGKRCNIGSCQAMCSSTPCKCHSREWRSPSCSS